MARLKLFNSKKSAAAAKRAPEVREKSSQVSQLQPVKIALLRPVISEKATLLKDKANAYVFKINSRATKVEVASEVAKAYKVKVQQVRIINLPRKPKRMGRSHGYQSGYKKAVVYLKTGDKIDLI